MEEKECAAEMLSGDGGGRVCAGGEVCEDREGDDERREDRLSGGRC